MLSSKLILKKLNKENYILKFKKNYGYIKFYESKTYFYIVFLEIYDTYKRQGFGSQLLQAIVLIARNKNKNIKLRALAVDLGMEQERLVNFYKRFGFVSKIDDTGLTGEKMVLKLHKRIVKC